MAEVLEQEAWSPKDQGSFPLNILEFWATLFL